VKQEEDISFLDISRLEVGVIDGTLVADAGKSRLLLSTRAPCIVCGTAEASARTE